MARIKISEFSAKNILSKELRLTWLGLPATISITTQEIISLFEGKKLVVKVDQGIKKRGKQGLVKINATPDECVQFIQDKSKQGYTQFLIEELVTHKPEEEHYLSIERVREGMRVLYSEKGGIEVEDNWESINESRISNLESRNKQTKSGETTRKTDEERRNDFVIKLCQIMDKYHFSFLEINPLVELQATVSKLQTTNFQLLDCAVLADDAGSRPYGSSSAVDELSEHPAEKQVRQLDATTPASLKLKVINPNGSIWMLLSGGGASLVLADEVADLGYGKELGNYGEYSGSPSTEDTYLYTKTIIKTMLDSKAEKKVLVIAGGVANFTDVTKTFKGIIQALKEEIALLQKQHIQVYVRRGGPNQDKGLALMHKFLSDNEILGHVAGPEMVLTEIVKKALSEIQNSNNK
ncbi:MAG: ATP citrate lyase citrate-binding domain-containing protein [Patescibacteria group bacterium]|jgi:ATP-citrate lyase beta-subunit